LSIALTLRHLCTFSSELAWAGALDLISIYGKKIEHGLRRDHRKTARLSDELRAMYVFVGLYTQIPTSRQQQDSAQFLTNILTSLSKHDQAENPLKVNQKSAVKSLFMVKDCWIVNTELNLTEHMREAFKYIMLEDIPER